jgi:c(7)-type cytochrome triheme protein
VKHKVSVLLILATAGCLSFVAAETFGTKKRTPKPNEFGNVVINNHGAQIDLAPVVFPHWLHRARYTCRLCHVDLGFAMAAGETGILDEDNKNGLYCGACHDGKEAFPQEQAAEEGESIQYCDRCHSQGKKVEFEYSFYDSVKGFPKSRFGNRIDWMAAEEQGLIELKDYLEGVSIDRGKLKGPADRKLIADALGMPSIIFSHEKHAVWNGCELCHPQIFPIRKSDQVYDMQSIFDGQFCGACHGLVAFPNTDCRLCHTEDVQ